MVTEFLPDDREELADTGAPLFDIRIGEDHRGKGLGKK
jgi:hypothetical protein